MLEVQNIVAGYGKREVLHKLSVSFEKGKLTSVVGTNGCGKSTLLKAILGILPHTEGEIYVDGARISALQRKEIAKRLAYLSQGKDTPDMTVGQLVLHGRFPYLCYPRRYSRQDREIAHAAMDRMGLTALAEEPLASLSGGMRQNAYIAMALAQDTDYILLDEPTTYLDIGHQLRLMQLLRGFADAGKTIIAVMHDLPLAFAFSDTVAVMKEGHIVDIGRPDALCKSGSIEATFGVAVQAEKDAYFYNFK